MQKKYEDIINLKRPFSKRKPMSRRDRAAQFAPFAALTGYSDAIDETARLTMDMTILNSDETVEIDSCLQFLRDNINCKPVVNITYFLPDSRKEGVNFYNVEGVVKKIKQFEKIIVMEDLREIPICNITKIFTL